MRTIAPVLLIGAVLLAGCQGDSEPADPPSSQDSLTTATLTTSDAAPTTEAPGDDVEQTTAPSDTVETTEASGPPVMPEEAQEDSEAGAKAFVMHYLDTFNYATMTPESGLLDPLGDESCETCNAFIDIVAEYTSANERANGPILTFTEPTGSLTGDHAVLYVEAVQAFPARLNAEGHVVGEEGSPEAFTMVVRLNPTTEGWIISEIQLG